MSAALVALVAVLAGGAAPSQRIYVPEGWYQVEDGEGEAEGGEVAIVIVHDEPALAQAQPPPVQPAPALPPPPPPAADLSEEIARFNQIDCELVRGRYLERVLELHGVDTFALDARLLAAWTRVRPPPGGGGLFGYNGVFGDPALALLWGEPPVPPGSLSFDFTLQNLARDLLRCPVPAVPVP